MNKVTQRDVVLGILKEGKTISSMEAFELGITRLSAIIFELRKQYIIATEDRECVTRYGRVAKFADYRLIGELEHEVA